MQILIISILSLLIDFFIVWLNYKEWFFLYFYISFKSVYFLKQGYNG